jgi:hypothetical protein
VCPGKNKEPFNPVIKRIDLADDMNVDTDDADDTSSVDYKYVYAREERDEAEDDFPGPSIQMAKVSDIHPKLQSKVYLCSRTHQWTQSFGWNWFDGF